MSSAVDLHAMVGRSAARTSNTIMAALVEVGLHWRHGIASSNLRALFRGGGPKEWGLGSHSLGA
jgi:hypothetical protein